MSASDAINIGERYVFGAMIPTSLSDSISPSDSMSFTLKVRDIVERLSIGVSTTAVDGKVTTARLSLPTSVNTIAVDGKVVVAKLSLPLTVNTVTVEGNTVKLNFPSITVTTEVT